MKRKHKQYSRPKRPFDKTRILEEEKIKKEFGLKNKKEIWRSESKVKIIRRRAKSLISASADEQKKFFDKLKKMGFNANSIAEVLTLDKNDYLKRRLQTVIIAKKIVRTPKHARQFIVHKKILVDGEVVNSPSYIVPVELENKISLKIAVERSKKEENKPNENQTE